jgi:hypothetical protein
MKTISCALAAWCLLVAIPRAQDTARTEPAQPVDAHKTMMLTGCLVAGGDASTFRLTNAVPNAQATAVQPQAVATAGQRAVYELKAETRLDAPAVAPVDLKTFIGKKVEVTARPDDTTAAPAPAKAAGQPTTDPDPGKPADEKVERLMVTAVKQVAATCQ